MRDAQAVAGKKGRSGVLDICRGDGFQLGQLLIHQLPRQADGFQLADGGGLAGDRVAFVDQPGDDLGAHAGQFFGGGRVLLQILQLAPQAGFGLRQSFAGLHVWCGGQHEQAVAARVGVVPGRGAGNQLLAAFQAGRQARAVTAIEQGGDQAQSVNLTRRFGGGQAGPVEAHHQARQLGLQVQGDASFARCIQLERDFRRWHGALGNIAEEALGQHLHFAGADIADHHQGGVVRRIPGLIPGAQLLDGHAFEVGHPADGRGVVAAGGVGHGLETFESFARRFVVGAQAAFLLDHLDFAGELLGRQLEAGQAVCFQFQGHGQAIARQHLVIGGVVVAGKGVLFGAEFAQDARGFAGAELAAAFEHHVFEGMGQAGLTGRFVTGADLVPELGDHHRGAVILADYHLEAVIEHELVGRLRRGGQGQQGCTKGGEK